MAQTGVSGPVVVDGESFLPGQQEDRQRVIARLEDDEQLSASGGWHEKGIAGEWVQVHHAPCMP